MTIPTIQNIMITNVVSVHPETSLLEASALITQHNFSGMPVVDDNNVIQGVITEYDLIIKGASLHLPTLQKILKELPVFGKDRDYFNKEIEDLQKLKVKDVMNPEPLTLPKNASFEEVVITFRDHHGVNPIPVINKGNKVVGIVSRFDVLKLFDISKFNLYI